MADITVHEAEHGGHDSAAHNENLKFAMWLYLTSEVVLFAMLLAGYAIFRATQVSSVNLVKDALGIVLVTANTFVLLLSSYAMVMGLRAIRMGNRQGFYKWIGATALLGTVFLGGQYIEYSELGHLDISVNKQDFTVATNIFEHVNHVEAEIDAAQVYTYNPAYAEAEEGEDVPLFNVSSQAFEIHDLREVYQYGNVLDIPASLSNATILLPAGTSEADLATIPNVAERNLTIVVGNITTYHVDFLTDTDDDAEELFADVDLEATEINADTKATIEHFLIDWNEDFILLDTAAENPVAEDALEGALEEINNSLEAQQIRQDNRVPLSRLAVQTVDGNIVSLRSILEGQAVDLDPAQYANLNAYFRAIIGDAASNYGMRFYTPTAFHGAHVFIGVLWALFVLWRGSKGAYDKNAIGLELFGLYWHFVDVVWIVLFTLIYLV